MSFVLLCTGLLQTWLRHLAIGIIRCIAAEHAADPRQTLAGGDSLHGSFKGTHESSTHRPAATARHLKAKAGVVLNPFCC